MLNLHRKIDFSCREGNISFIVDAKDFCKHNFMFLQRILVFLSAIDWSLNRLLSLKGSKYEILQIARVRY